MRVSVKVLRLAAIATGVMTWASIAFVKSKELKK